MALAPSLLALIRSQVRRTRTVPFNQQTAPFCRSTAQGYDSKLRYGGHARHACRCQGQGPVSQGIHPHRYSHRNVGPLFQRQDRPRFTSVLACWQVGIGSTSIRLSFLRPEPEYEPALFPHTLFTNSSFSVECSRTGSRDMLSSLFALSCITLWLWSGHAAPLLAGTRLHAPVRTGGRVPSYTIPSSSSPKTTSIRTFGTVSSASTVLTLS